MFNTPRKQLGTIVCNANGQYFYICQLCSFESITDDGFKQHQKEHTENQLDLKRVNLPSVTSRIFPRTTSTASSLSKPRGITPKKHKVNNKKKSGVSPVASSSTDRHPKRKNIMGISHNCKYCSESVNPLDFDLHNQQCLTKLHKSRQQIQNEAPKPRQELKDHRMHYYSRLMSQYSMDFGLPPSITGAANSGSGDHAVATSSSVTGNNNDNVKINSENTKKVSRDNIVINVRIVKPQINIRKLRR